MNPAIRVDTREFQAAARELFKTSSRTCADFTNGQALKVAVEATRRTEKANRLRIAYQLGVIGRDSTKRVVSRGKNKGAVRFKLGRYETREDSFAERILGARFKATRKWGVKGETVQERIHNFIAIRMRAASFIASGWIGARNRLWSVVRKKPAGAMALAGARQYGQPKGSAIPASFRLRSEIQATIINTALLGHETKAPAPGGNPMPIAVRGLQAALNEAARDMLAELARRLDPDFKKVSAR